MTRLVTAAFLIPAAWYLCKRAPLGLFLGAALLLGVFLPGAVGAGPTKGAGSLRQQQADE